MIHLSASLRGEAGMLPHWLNLNHFLSSFLRQASWSCPVWSKLEAITSGSGEITSLHYRLWLIFHNTADSFKVLTETLNTRASVTVERFWDDSLTGGGGGIKDFVKPSFNSENCQINWNAELGNVVFSQCLSSFKDVVNNNDINYVIV